MKILWYGDTPWFSSGYGRIANLLLPKLAEKGVEIIIQAKFGHYGSPIDLGYAILYGAISDTSLEVIPTIAKKHKVDLIVMMCDIWAYDFKNLRQEEEHIEHIPIVVYYPLDTDEVPYAAIEQLRKYVDFIIPMSNHAYDKLTKILPKDNILDVIYPPIPETFKPKDISRDDIGFKGYDIVFGMIQMNKDIVRKDQVRQLYAIKQAIEKVKKMGIDKKVGIYCHMLPSGKGTGFNLTQFAESIGISEDLQFPIPSAYLIGFTDEQMTMLINGFDVLLQCTSGEGFGMPTVEAMLCNTPVIGASNSTTKELVERHEDNFPIMCNELQYLAQAPSNIASFDHMVNTIAEIIINGVEKSENLRESIAADVDIVYVISQWMRAFDNIQKRIDEECRVVPEKGHILLVNQRAISVTRRNNNG